MLLVRNGQKVWPYCPECGCRLKVDNVTSWLYYFVFHYYNRDGLGLEIDARGCKCSLKGEIKRLNRWEYPDLEQYGWTPQSKV